MPIGVDLVEIRRIARMSNHPRFMARIYTAEEIRLASGSEQRRAEFLAGRFAGKEAAFKALWGIRPGATFLWKNVEILRGAGGEPKLHLSGLAQEILRDTGLKNAEISLSHTRDFAIAMVFLR